MLGVSLMMLKSSVEIIINSKIGQGIWDWLIDWLIWACNSTKRFGCQNVTATLLHHHHVHITFIIRTLILLNLFIYIIPFIKYMREETLFVNCSFICAFVYGIAGVRTYVLSLSNLIDVNSSKCYILVNYYRLYI